MEEKGEKYVVTAAIDFGTTFSGYGFGFHNDNAILVNKNWGSNFGYHSYKTPTSVLTGPNNEFVSFGYEAENDFSTEEKGPEAGYNLFRHFKMKLHRNKIYLSQYILSTTGKRVLAKDIFVMAVKYLKEHMLECIHAADVRTLDGSLIKWVITVPAIWNEESKYFMRDVAYSAGIITDIVSRQLVVALEPEVASVYCQSDISCKGGEQYLVIDAGGGTVDITAHELVVMGRVKEVHPPSGGPWGGKCVDENFEKLLGELFGSEFIARFKVSCPIEWMKLLQMFETTKGLRKKNKHQNMKIIMSYSFGMEFKRYSGEAIDTYIEHKQFKGVTFQNGSLVIAEEIVATFFADVVEKIVDHLNDLLKNPNISPKYIILVGGFGECDILQKAVTDVFGATIKVIIPDDAQLAVLKGAVLFGKQPDICVSRLSRFTYGIGINVPFKDGYHKAEYKYNNHGEWYCKNIFKPIIKKGEEVKGSSTKVHEINETEDGYKAGFSTIYIFYSEKKNNPGIYTTDKDVQQLAKLVVHHDKSKTLDATATEVIFHVGGTQLIVEAKSTTKAKKVKAVLNFQ